MEARREVLLASEKDFMLPQMDRSKSEKLLRTKAPGAFLLRPKDEHSLVVSYVANDRTVKHTVVHRVRDVYQASTPPPTGDFATVQQFLDALRAAQGLEDVMFASRAPDYHEEPPQTQNTAATAQEEPQQDATPKVRPVQCECGVTWCGYAGVWVWAGVRDVGGARVRESHTWASHFSLETCNCTTRRLRTRIDIKRAR